MKRKLMFFMTFLFVGIGLVTAQTSRVSGTTLGPITDIDGKFTITNVPSSSKTY